MRRFPRFPRPPRRALARLSPSRLSLRTRLLVLALALVTTGLVVSDTVVLGTVRMQLVERADQQLQRFAEPLSRRAAGGGRSFGQGPNIKRVGQFLPSQYVVQYLAADGSVKQVLRQPIAESDPSPEIDDLTPAQLAARQGVGFDVPDEHGQGTWRVLVLPLSRASTSSDFSAPSYLLAAVSLDDVDSTVGKLRGSFLAIGGAVLVLITALGAFAVRAGLRPLARIGQDADLIAEGRLSHRMPELAPRTEVGRLSATLNGMLTQIEAAFAARAESEARMRRFVADASHELRTPLAGIRGFAELYRMGALSDVGTAMQRIESEAVRMGGLVEDLLTLARLDEERPLDLAPMDLRTLAADALHDLTALDPGRPVALTGPDGTGAPQPAPVLGDEARLRQVVTNLVGNAVKHTPSGTAVRIGVGVSPADGRCLLEVADSGPGLPADQAAQVFERFYRVDPSRSRLEGGGAGLGLAIASALVHAHGGSLALDTAPGRGAAFRMMIPRQA